MNTNLLRTLIIAAVASTALASSMLAAEISPGTHLLLTMENSISTRTARIGDGVHLRTVTPISVGGKIVVPIGTYAQGVVTQAKRSGRGHGKAELQIQLVRLLLPSGEILKISPRTSSFRSDGDGPRRTTRALMGGLLIVPSVLGGALVGVLAGGEDGAQTGAYVGLGVGVAAIVLPAILGRGKEIELRQGTDLDVAFDEPATIE
jgi:hypothetical protein